VLRAIGYTRYRIKALYFYEALVLVISSSLLGVGIGCLVGYTILLQQSLFLGIPLVFMFPGWELLFIILISLVCAFVATYTPATQLTNMKVASIFRLT
jgi:ABC-type antimicrobial peptide transport system permease subunit